ncbi:MAG: ABC transporter permease [Gemmatimonadota bacterium]|jgi:putative ABC transport system permease protein
MDRVRTDLRFALRSAARSPLFAFTVIATLGLGIGANTAIFSFVDALLLRPLPYPEPDRMVVVWQDFSATGGPAQEWFTPPDYEDLARDATTLAASSPIPGFQANLTGGGEPERLQGLAVAPGYFDVTGVKPAIGRAFDADEASRDAHVLVISHDLWTRRYGADPDMVGRTLELNGTAWTVVGVMPREFQPPFAPADVWRPYRRELFGDGCGRGCYVMQVLARVRPGASPEQVGADLTALGEQILSQAPGAKAGLRLRAVPLQEQLAGPTEPALLALLGAVGLLLLIACVNIANLLLARAGGREREMAIRTAIGANRGTLIRQLLTESVILAVAGGAAGVLLAFWGVDLLVAMSPPGTPRLEDVVMDGRALGFAAAASVLTAVLFGLVPAIHLSASGVADSLREAGGLRSGAGRRRLRNLFVVAETAIALTLLTGAGLLMRSFLRLQAVDAGFDASHALTVPLILPRAGYPDAAQRNQFWGRLTERLEARPGVVAAAGLSVLPLSGTNTDIDLLIEGRPVPATREDQTVANYRSVTPGFIAAMGMRLLRGRGITAADRTDAPLVAVINQTLAARYWPGEDAMGKRFSAEGPDGPWVTVVGIVADVHHDGLDLPVRPEMWLPVEQVPDAGLTLVLRTDGDPAVLGPLVRAEVRALDPDLPLGQVSTLDRLVANAVAVPRLFVAFFGFFALVALMLAAVGIYGVTAYTVGQRTQEIGVRIALGADARGVIAMIVGQAMRVAGAGIAIGVVAALVLSRALGSLLFELSPTDPATFLAIVLLLAGVSFVACWLPARRAAGVRPVDALRRE